MDEIHNALERMLQGLAYWIAYKNEINIIGLKETDIVSEAAAILTTHLHNYRVKSEVDYSLLNHSLQKQYADLGIFSYADQKYQCIIEFKLGENTNGGYKKDVEKLHQLKTLEKNIKCFVILAYRKSCSVNVPRMFVTKDGTAKKRIQIVSDKAKVKVRRVCKAHCSTKAKKNKKVICLEVL